MLPILQLGPLTMRTPGLALLAGLWFGLEAASREGACRGISEDHILNFGFSTIIAGILGARLGFIALNSGLYLGITPWLRALQSVFALAPGTENVWIGLGASVLVAAFLIRRWQLNLLALADALAPALAIFTVAIGLANLLSGDYYGVETTLPWGIPLWGSIRQPTQVYFVLLGILILTSLWRLGGLRCIVSEPAKKKGKRQVNDQHVPGFYFQIAGIILCFGLLLIEPLRADSPVIGDGVRIWEIVGLVGLVVSLALTAWRAPVQAGEPE
jgi:phosphatidylglycerol:prolipoprotein diacylglycerol transferase